MGNNCCQREKDQSDAPLVRKNSAQLKKPSGHISFSKKYTMDDGAKTFLKPPKLQKQNTPNTLSSSIHLVAEDDLDGSLELVRKTSDKSHIKLPQAKIVEGSIELKKRNSSPSETESLTKIMRSYNREACLSNINKTKSRLQQSAIKQYQSQIQLEKKWSMRQIRHMEVDLLRLKNDNKELKTTLLKQRIEKKHLEGELKEKEQIIKKLSEKQAKLKMEKSCLVEVLQEKSKELGKTSQELKQIKKMESKILNESRDNQTLIQQVDSLLDQKQELFSKLKDLIQHCGQQELELRSRVKQVKLQKAKNKLMKMKTRNSSDELGQCLQRNQAEKNLLFFKDQKTKLETILNDEKKKKIEIQIKKKLILSILSRLEKNVENRQWDLIPKVFQELDQNNMLGEFAHLIKSMNQIIVELTYHCQKMPAGAPPSLAL